MIQFVQLYFFCLYKRTQFVQLAGIELTIQHSSKYLFGFLNNINRSEFCSNWWCGNI